MSELKPLSIPALPSKTQKEVKQSFYLIKDWSDLIVSKISTLTFNTVKLLYSLVNPRQNQALMYDVSSGLWKNKTIDHTWLTTIGTHTHDQIDTHIDITDGNPHGTTWEQLVEKADYGAFQDNTTQTAANINTAYNMTFDTTDFSSGISRGTPTSRIVVSKQGVYNVQFSAQLRKTSASVGYAWIWIKVNGNSIVDSATKIAIQGSTAECVAAWNWFVECNANDYIELAWAVDSTAIQILHESATAFCPAIPSIILTVSQVA